MVGFPALPPSAKHKFNVMECQLRHVGNVYHVSALIHAALRHVQYIKIH